MAPILTNGERPASAVQLAGPILVETGRGEVEGSAGDYLVVTTAGRQVVMSEKEYRTATGAPGGETVSPPPAEVVTPKPEPAPTRARVRLSLPKIKGVSRAQWQEVESRIVHGINLRLPGRKPAPETCEPLAIASARESETSAREPEPPAEVSIPINLCQIDTSEESPAGTSSPVDIPENVSSPVDVQPEPEGVKREELPPSSDQIELKCAEPEVAADPPNFPPPTPRPVYNPRADLANLVLPKRKPGMFQKFMRPGASEPEKKSAGKKKPFALAFGKKKAKVVGPEPPKDKWPTVQPEWI